MNSTFFYRSFFYIFFILFSSSNFIYSQNLYTSKDFTDSHNAFVNGEVELLKKSVLSNLKKNNFNAYTIAKLITTNIDSTFIKSLSTENKEILNFCIEIEELSNQERSIEIYKKYQTFRYKKKLPLETMYTIAGNIDNISYDATIKLTNTMLEVYGDVFRASWMLDYNLGYGLRMKFLKTIQQDSWYNKYPLFKSYANHLLAFPSEMNLSTWSNMNSYHNVSNFIKSNPNDALAYRKLAHELKALNRLSEAKKAYFKSYELDPFYSNGKSFLDALVCDILLGNNNQDKQLKKYIKNHFKDDSKIYITKAKVYNDAEEYMIARETLKNIKSNSLDFIEASVLLAQIEFKDKRYNEAINAIKSLPIKTIRENLLVYDLYLKSLNKLEYYEDLYTELEDYIQESDNNNDKIYYQFKAFFEKIDNYTKAESVMKTAIGKFPYSYWMHANLADANKNNNKLEKAVKNSLKSIEFNPNFNFSQDILHSVRNKQKINFKDDVKKLYQNKKYSYLLADKYLTEIVDKEELPSNSSEKLPMYRYNYIKKTTPKSVAFFIEELKTAKKKIDSVFILNLLNEEFLRLSSRFNIDRNKINEYLAINKAYKKLGGDLTKYHKTNAYLYRSLNSKEKEKYQYEIQQAIKHSPNDYALIETSLISFQNPNAFKSMKALVEKNHYNYTNLTYFALRNGTYGGSNINVIWAYNKCKSIYPEKPCRASSYYSAQESLGNPIENFKNYKKTSKLGTTKRYINWYNNNRQKTLSNLSSSYTYNKEENKITVVDQKGQEYSQIDDPYFGKPTLKQKGSIWIKYKYDSITGKIKQIETSTKEKISLNYNSKGNVSKIMSSEDGNFTLLYNNKDQNTHLIIDRDTILFSYLEDGNIDVSNSKSLSDSLSIYQGASKFSKVIRKSSSYTTTKNLEDLSLKDNTYEKLKTNFEELDEDLYYADEDYNLTKDKLNTATLYTKYLKNNLAYGIYNKNELLRICYNLSKLLTLKNNTSDVNEELLNYTNTYYQTLLETQKYGVTLEIWEQWNKILNLVEEFKNAQTSLTKSRIKAEKLLKKYNLNPIKILESSKWLSKSDLTNEAYWSSQNLQEVIPNFDFVNNNINDILKKKNNDIIMTTNNGLSVKTKGYWQFLYYDFLKKKFTNNQDSISLKSNTKFYSLFEIDSGEVVISSNRGILLLDKNSENISRLKCNANNYIGNKPVTINKLDTTLIINNSTKINFLSLKNEELQLDQSISFEENSIKKVIIPTAKVNNYEADSWSEESGNATYEYETYNDRDILVLTKQGVFILNFDIESLSYQKELLIDKPNISHLYVESIVDSYELIFNNYIYYLHENELFKGQINKKYNEDNSVDFKTDVTKIRDQIIFNKQLLGITELPISKNETAVAVISDKGLNIVKDHHIEFFEIKSQTGIEELNSTTYYDPRAFGILTNKKLHHFSLENYQYHDNYNNIKKIKKINGLPITLYLTKNNSLKYSSYEFLDSNVSTGGWGDRIYDFYDNKDGTILLADRNEVYKSTYNTEDLNFTTESLFEISPHKEENGWITNNNDYIKKIFKAKDSTIWVHTKLSVFRYNEKLSPALKEFNFLKSIEEYPVPTLEVFNLIETSNGDILAINSDESWNNYKGRSLTGGILIYDKNIDKFVLYQKDDARPKSMPWFITSFTEVDNQLGIAGTSNGFAYLNKNGLKLVSETENESYLNIFKNHKNLFLGTKGAKFGNLYLFGCAEGVIGYKDGVWFYPDRLNQLLPKYSSFGKYGGNKVNAIEVDHENNLNIATELGLLVINTTQIDPNDLLMMDYSSDTFITHYDKEKLKKDQSKLTSLFPKSSPTSTIIKEAQSIKNEISELKALKKSFKEEFKLKTIDYKTVDIDSIDTKIKRMSNNYSKLILKLKQKNPIVYQTLKIPPLQIASIRNKLSNKECILQYIPLNNKLLIQVITNKKTILKEVDVSKKDLYKLALYTSDALSGNVKTRGIILEENEEENKSLIKLDDLLEQLYNYLLKPIEKELAQYNNNIQIIAEGALNYIPFDALVYKDMNNNKRSVVQNYHFTYLSSLYMLQLLDEYTENKNEKLLLIGDPDETLPFARVEVNEIAKKTHLKPNKYIGNQAKKDKFIKNSKNNSVIHLATHGHLNKDDVSDSWILFSDKKLKLSEVYELDLDKTNLIVLSACETALGKEGIETTNLAKAFANAGVNNIIASLWKVNDESTKILMTKFYEEIKNGLSYANALHSAKKYLMNIQNKKFSHPKFWSPFIIIGKSSN